MKYGLSISLFIIGIFTIAISRPQVPESCDPQISIEHQVMDKIKVEDVADCSEIRITCPEAKESDWQVESFQLVNVPRQGDPVVSVNKGSTFSAATKDILNRANVDDMLFFENIKLKQLSTGAQVEKVLVVEVY
jgi:hypothetical protein